MLFADCLGLVVIALTANLITHVLPIQSISVFLMALRTHKVYSYFPVERQLIDFITETECVYCPVRTESLRSVQGHASL